MKAPTLPEPFMPQAKRYADLSEQFDEGCNAPADSLHKDRPPEADDVYASERAHGKGNAETEAALRYERQSGPWRWWGELQGLGFAGAQGQDYAQLRAGTALGIGPAQVVVQADWAPPQAAIGGGNLHVRVLARTGVPGTPITLAAAIGRSTGNDDGSGQSRRLRPCGDYSDFLIDADHVRGALTLGATLTATTIDRGCGAADAGARLLFRASLGF